jgi:uncharacterized protein (DUF305 family)
MKTRIRSGLLFVVVGMMTAGCQNQASNNGAVNADPHSGHDMSNMKGHDASNMDHDMSSMRGHDMSNMNSDPGAAEQPYDLQYLDSMIHHHNGAVMMAKMVLDKSGRAELRSFAQKIIDDQTKEVGYMQQLRDQWYAGKPSSVNMEMPGMIGGMKTMNSNHMKEMDDMDPAHFDQHFLKMMIAHHEGAVLMSRETPQKAEHPEIRKLAEEIIKAQQPEIEQMKKWQTAWDK